MTINITIYYALVMPCDYCDYHIISHHTLLFKFMKEKLIDSIVIRQELLAECKIK